MEQNKVHSMWDDAEMLPNHSRVLVNIIAAEDGLVDVEGRRDIVSTEFQLISQLIYFI